MHRNLLSPEDYNNFERDFLPAIRSGDHTLYLRVIGVLIRNLHAANPGDPEHDENLRGLLVNEEYNLQGEMQNLAYDFAYLDYEIRHYGELAGQARGWLGGLHMPSFAPSGAGPGYWMGLGGLGTSCHIL